MSNSIPHSACVENFSVFGQIENLWMDEIYIKFKETELVEIS